MTSFFIIHKKGHLASNFSWWNLSYSRDGDRRVYSLAREGQNSLAVSGSVTMRGRDRERDRERDAHARVAPSMGLADYRGGDVARNGSSRLMRDVSVRCDEMCRCWNPMVSFRFSRFWFFE